MAPSNTAVLIVEDDPGTVSMERRLLEDGGYNVTSVASGEEAIALVSEVEPDLILLDVGLPGIDGYTTCKVLRKFSEAPIIMVSGRRDTSDKVRGIDIGADDYIGKPFAGDELLSRSKAVLRRGGSLNAARSKSAQTKSGGSPLSTGLGIGRGLAQQVSLANNPALKTMIVSSKASAIKLAHDLREKGLQGVIEDRRTHVRFKPLEKPSEQEPQNRSERAQRVDQAVDAIVAWLAVFGVWAWVQCHGAYTLMKKLVLSFRTHPKVKGFTDGVANFGNDDLKVALGKFGPKIVKSGKPLASEEPKPSGDVYVHVRMAAQEEMSMAPQVMDVPEEVKVPDEVEEEVVASAETEDTSDTMDIVADTEEATSVQPLSDAEPFYHVVFLEALLSSYISQISVRCEDPMLSVPVIPVIDTYAQVAEVLGRSQETYNRQDFAQDIYRLQVSGLDTTVTGAKVQLPISRGVPGKTLTILDESGREVRYYGIRFVQTARPARRVDREPRQFDSLNAPEYGAEVQELFAKLLEWPSAEFSTFFARQIGLNHLSAAELREFAQITRDALHRFLQERTNVGPRLDYDKVVATRTTQPALRLPGVNGEAETASPK